MLKFTPFFLIFLFLQCYANETKPVRGVWLTNVDSKALNSKEGITEAVSLCKEFNVNTIYVVAWNKAMTTYPSKILKKLTGVEIDTQMTGRDPLRELIEEAHASNIKVIAWFEFGFSSSYQQDGGVLCKLKPGWKSKNSKDTLVTKNGFDWLNGFNPEVQQFLLSLIMEVVRNYDVDGIQGDDRLPAMPVESGYDEYTTQLYMTQHNGKRPPSDFRDTAWVNWRAGLLNNFMKAIHDSVKNYNSHLIVSMAPSIYPWSKEEYLQDWPAWVREGWVDEICPQLYRYDVKDYNLALKNILNEQLSPEDYNKFFPGILLKVGKYIASDSYLMEAVKANRDNNVNGEVYFFYEGLKVKKDFFNNQYQDN